LSSKLSDSLKFLYNIDIIIPIENSTPLKPNIINDIENSKISLNITPKYIVNIYMTNHIISEIKIMFKKFFIFKNNKNISDQNIKFQNNIQENILNFYYNLFYL
jgi:hypothetical protein